MNEEERRQYHRDYYHKNKEKNKEKRKEYNRKADLKKSFGLTINEYDIMFEAQKGVCATCGKEETAKNQYGVVRLAVDHNHKTGKIRGLLCARCNRSIGLLNEDISTLLNIIRYLNEHK